MDSNYDIFGNRIQGRSASAKRYTKSYVTGVNVLISVILVISLIGATLCGVLLRWDLSDSGNAKVDMSNIQTSQHKDVQYFLVAGVDEGRTLTDIMMVVCFDTKNHTANIMQIPRDTFIGADVPTSKMNAVYGQAPREEGQSNINVMLRRINDYLGLPIDHYITVTLTAFRDIVDTVGGVDVYVPDTIYNAFNENDESYTFYAGMNHFNGSQAEAFVRHRKSYAMGDLGRIKAQRSFYSAFIKKCLEMDMGQLTSAATKIYDEITTDMKLVDILDYAKMAKKVSLDQINFFSIPGQSGTYSVSGGQPLSYYSIHKQEYVDVVNQNFMPYSEGITVESLLIEELHVSYSESYLEDKNNIHEYLGS